MKLKAQIRNFAAEIGRRLPAQPGAARSGPVAIMYHGIPDQPDALGMGREAFEEQMLFLRDHFEFVTPDWKRRPGQNFSRMQVLLTFDDGFLNNAEVAAPILRRLGIPAVFFVTTRHLTPGRVLWFAYLRALEEQYPGDALRFRGETFDLSRDLSHAGRGNALRRLRNMLLGLQPHPAAMYSAIENELPPIETFTSETMRRDRYDGMSERQLTELATDPLFTIGAHTADHPMLTRCSAEEQRTQMVRGRQEIERVTGRSCDLFAYPSDDHDSRVHEMVAQLDFRAVFSVHRTVDRDPMLAVPRVGVYYPGLPELGFKIQWNGVLRQLQQWNPANSN